MHHDIAYDEKESRRWLEAAEVAAKHLAPVATQVVVVVDREGDTNRNTEISRSTSSPGLRGSASAFLGRRELCVAGHTPTACDSRTTLARKTPLLKMFG